MNDERLFLEQTLRLFFYILSACITNLYVCMFFLHGLVSFREFKTEGLELQNRLPGSSSLATIFFFVHQLGVLVFLLLYTIQKELRIS